jgi:ABC-type glycerol-3-phosphate transport system substrate-binding protein
MPSLPNVRPFQLILMVVFAVLAVLGVVVFANYSGGSSGPKIGAVTIWGTLPSDAMSKEIATIANTNKSYGKVSYVQKQPATFDTDLANAIASGSGPDLILITQEQLLTERSKITVIPFSSIPQRTFSDTYLPEFQLYLTSSGTYGIPFVLDPMVLYYNKTLLTQGGVAVPPASWEGVTGLASTLTQRNGPAITLATIPFGVYDNTENARGIISLLFLQAGSPITGTSQGGGVRSSLEMTNQSSGSQRLDTTNQTPAAESALAFFTQFADPARTVYSWNPSFPSARQAFIGGTLAFYPGFASDEPALSAANPNLAFDMVQIPQPQTAVLKTDYGLAYAFAIPKASANPIGAYLTAKTLSNMSYLGGIAADLSVAPSVRSLLVSSSTDQFSPVYYPEALIAQGWLSPAPNTTDTLFSSMISNITSGKFAVRAALQSTDQALTTAVQTL